MIPLRTRLAIVLAIGSTSVLACARTAPVPAPTRTLYSFGSEAELESMIRGIELRRAEVERVVERQRIERAAAMATVPAPSAECRGAGIVTRRARRATAAADSVAEAVIVASVFARSSAFEPVAQPIIRVTGPAVDLSRQSREGGATLRLRLAQASDSVVVRAVRIGLQAQQLKLRLTAGDSVEVVFELCELAVFLNQVVVTGTWGAAKPEKILDSPNMLTSESLTNVQHAGVDEGGIVKRVGEHLVILRRGRLYSVRVADSALRAVASHPASPAGAGKGGVWLDELLSFENQVVVIGYSYEMNANEVTRFRVRDDGEFEWMETQHFRSDDYYSSRNYASRLIDDELIFYTPIFGFGNARKLRQALPHMRPWNPTRVQKWQRTARGEDIYATREAREHPEASSLHVVTRCSLRNVPLACRSTAVMGAGGEVFYVSPRHVYVWTGAYARGRSTDSLGVLFRMPLDGSAPAAVRVRGMPIDQLSFHEDSAGTLHVLTDPRGAGTWMYRSEQGRRSLALLHIAPSDFSDGNTAASPSAYRSLSLVPMRVVNARFVRNVLLVGAGSGWGRGMPATMSKLQVVPLDGGPSTLVPLHHSVNRVEVMGPRAVAIGNGKNALHFSAIDLNGVPHVGYQARIEGASQGETRSHAYFYNPEGDGQGMLGFPVRASRQPAWVQLGAPSLSVALLRNTGDRLVLSGALEADTHKQPPECVTSCADWYGNSRPLFFDGRILALIGDEIVEGVERNGQIVELRRVRLAPAVRARGP